MEDESEVLSLMPSTSGLQKSNNKPNDEDFIELILNENDQMEVDVQDEVEAVLVENVARKTNRVARGLYKEVPKDQPTMLNFFKRK